MIVQPPPSIKRATSSGDDLNKSRSRRRDSTDEVGSDKVWLSSPAKKSLTDRLSEHDSRSRNSSFSLEMENSKHGNGNRTNSFDEFSPPRSRSKSISASVEIDKDSRGLSQKGRRLSMALMASAPRYVGSQLSNVSSKVAPSPSRKGSMFSSSHSRHSHVEGDEDDEEEEAEKHSKFCMCGCRSRI